MADARISIGINADVGNALSGLQKLSAAIGSTVSAIDKLSPSANQAGSNLNKAFSGIGSIDTSKFTSAQGVISSSVDKMVSDAGRSGAAFSALSGQLQAFGGGVNKFVSSFKNVQIDPNLTRLPGLFNQVETSANNAAQSLRNIKDVSVGEISIVPPKVDLSGSFVDSQAKIDASVNEIVSDVGRAGTAFNDLKTTVSGFGGGVNTFVSSFKGVQVASDQVVKSVGQIKASLLQLNVSTFGGGVKAFQQTLTNLTPASVVVIRSIDSLESELNELNKQLKATSNAADFNRINSQIRSTATELSKLRAGALTGGKGVLGFADSQNRANQSLIDFGRLVQDAPYTVISGNFGAIANNINPLLESFQRLKVSTGSTSGALKSLAGSMLGPAGIGIAVSVVSSLLVLFGDKLFGAGRKAKEAANATKDMADAVKSVFEEAGKEAAQVTSFIAVLKSETETRERRLSAIKELQRISPDIFNNLKLEGDAVIGVDAAYKTYLENIKTVLAVKIKQIQLEKELTKLLELQGIALTKSQKDFIGNLKNINKGFTDISKSADDPNAKRFFENLEQGSKDAQKEIQDNIDDIFKDIQELSKGVKLPEIKGPETKDAEKKILDFAKKIQELLITPKPIIFSEFDTDKDALNKAKATISGFLDGTIFKIKLQPVVSLSEPEIGGSLDLSFLQKQLVDIETKLKVTTDAAEFDRLTVAADLVRQQISSILSELTRDVLKTYDKLIDGSDKSFRTGAILGQQFVDGFIEAAESSTGTGLLTAFQADILTKEFEKEFAKFGKNLPKIDIGKSLFANREDLSKQLKQVAQSFEFAKIAAGGASDAFGAAFDALIEGENAVDAIANAFKRLVQDIARAIVQAVIFKTISSLFGFPGLPGSGVAASADGTGGQIAGLGGLSTPGGQTARLSPGLIPVQVSGQFVQRGNVMVATISQTQISQGRNG